MASLTGSLCSSFPRSTVPRSGTRKLHLRAASGGRRPWDFGRFIKTVTTFNPPPTFPEMVGAAVVQPLKMLKWILPPGGDQEAQPSIVQTLTIGPGALSPSGGLGPVLVVGATSNLGTLIVEALLAQGRQVRVLASRKEEASAAFKDLKAAPGARLDVYEGEVSRPSTLSPQALHGISAIISCMGIEDHENADAALVNLLRVAEPAIGRSGGKALFAPSNGEAKMSWAPLDDVVMGGCSISSFQVEKGAGEDGLSSAGVFSGVVSTDNSGGFSSVRTLNLSPALDLRAYQGIRLRLFGDGLRYKFILRTDTNWDTVTYCSSFDTRAGEWQDVDLRFADFVPVFRARTVPDGDPLETSNIVSLQLMLSKFEYDGNLNPSFSGGTEKILQASGVPYTVVTTCSLVDDSTAGGIEVCPPGTASSAVSRRDLAGLCVALPGLPQALNTTIAVSGTGGEVQGLRDWGALLQLYKAKAAS